jgi:hypothetical protein
MFLKHVQAFFRILLGNDNFHHLFFDRGQLPDSDMPLRRIA